MVNRLVLTLVLFVIADAVLMGVGALLILTIPSLNNHAMQYFLPMVYGASAISLVASFMIAPKLRATNEAGL